MPGTAEHFNGADGEVRERREIHDAPDTRRRPSQHDNASSQYGYE
jgi:hypothetical protein